MKLLRVPARISDVAQTLSLPRRDSSRRLSGSRSKTRHECRVGRHECPRHISRPVLIGLTLSLILCTATLWAQAVEVATVHSQTLARKTRLPGEIYPYLRTPIQARVTGFVEEITVDRGSQVKKGQLLIRLSAPEIAAQIAEASAKVRAVESQRAEAEAKVVAAQATYDRMKAASATPGVIAANELTLAEKSVDAHKALVRSLEVAAQASRSAIPPLQEMQGYLAIRAPFDGIVTERNVHPGALAGPGAQTPPLLVIEQQSRLRLIVAVPEMDAGSIARGAQVNFKLPAYPGMTFSGTVARLTNTMDPKTRTLPVELDVPNPKSELAPGMYPEVEWPVRRTKPSLLVPPTAVVTTTERSFVIRVTNGKAEWVNVAKGVAAGDLVEVMGAVSVGDVVVKRASDEIRDGSAIAMKK